MFSNTGNELNSRLIRADDREAENGTPPLMNNTLKSKPNVRTDELLRSLPVGGVSIGCFQGIGEHAPIKYKPQQTKSERRVE